VWVPSLGAWRTILVGGLGAGGRGYFALDITDPANPQALWEFTNDSLGGNGNLGLTFGNPVITKRANGSWVVMFTSGYNNVSPGDGNGRLYVVDARTGQRLDEIETFTGAGVKAGTAAAPSGLGKINAWVESQTDNTTLRVYGGDFLGNVWRFDIDNLVQPNHAALRLAYLRDGVKAQPITTRPEVVNVPSGGTSHAVVYVGTGVLLRTNDLLDTSVQSVYAIKDPLTNTPLGDLRARTDLVTQTLTVETDKSRTVTNLPVDWVTKSGWRVDFPTSGERVNIDMRLALTTLVVGTNAPASNAICADGGGESYLYKFDFTNGSSVPAGGGTVGISLGNAFVVGVGVMQLYADPSTGGTGAGGGGAVARTQMGDGSVMTDGMYTPTTAAVEGRRTSWRELVN
jgi:type IV pilus assembly protein PilY1